MKLTPAAARDLQPGQILRDHEVRGLMLRAGARSKTWLLNYRAPDGTERRPKLGDFPTLPLSAARDAARALLLQVAAGRDPSAERTALRAEPTVADLCDWYMSTWAPRHHGPQHLYQTLRLVEDYIKPELGTTRLRKLTAERVNAWLDDIHHRRLPVQQRATRLVRVGKATAPAQAATAKRGLSAVLGTAAAAYLETLGKTYADVFSQGNPAARASPRSIPPRKRRATGAELVALAASLAAERAAHPNEVALLRALFFTGARVGELLLADNRDLVDGTLHLRRHKTAKHIGEKFIPLPQLVLQDLADLDTAGSTRLFGAVSRMTFRRVWARVRKNAGVGDLQLRDARRTFASHAVGSGVHLDAVGDLFGHTSTQTTRGYTWLLEEARRGVAETGAANIAKSMGET